MALPEDLVWFSVPSLAHDCLLTAAICPLLLTFTGTHTRVARTHKTSINKKKLKNHDQVKLWPCWGDAIAG